MPRQYDYHGSLEIDFRAELPGGDACAEFDIMAEYEFTPPFYGSRDEPPHGGNIEILSVSFRRSRHGKWFTLPERAYDYVKLADRIYEDHEIVDEAAERAAYRYEQRRDARMEASND